MVLTDYIEPSLLFMVPLLYALGKALKASGIKDYKIPFILGFTAVPLAWCIIFGNSLPEDFSQCVSMALSGIVQGIICAAVSVYGHNLYKQYKEKDNE